MDQVKVRDLRARTGAGIVDCTKALAEVGDDVEKAVDILRKKGLASAAKKVGRITQEGVIDAYIHPGDRLGVLLEVNCALSFYCSDLSFVIFYVLHPAFAKVSWIDVKSNNS